MKRLEEHGVVIFALSGRVEEAHIADLGDLFEKDSGVNKLAIDLKEVRLVDRPIVKFLAACEKRGVEIRNCPSYVREWIDLGAGDKGDGDEI